MTKIDQIATFSCVACGKPGTETQLFKLRGAINENAYACALCLARFGNDALAREYDRQLSEATVASYIQPRCLHCGEPVIMLGDGNIPLWCSACERERRELYGKR
jgi:hypothetical protein